MNLFGLEIRRASAVPVHGSGGWWPLVREPFTGAWQRNQEWKTESVLAHHAVYTCVTRISQDIGKLWPRLVELTDDGIWQGTQNPAFDGVLLRPNRFQNHIQFKEWWVTSKLLHGNTYGLIERNGRETVRAIHLLDPTRVTVLVSPDGEVLYQIKADNLAGVNEDEVVVPASEMIHDRMNCLFHPLVGVSPIFASGAAANMGLMIERNSTEFFSKGSHPSGILSTVQSITPKRAEELVEMFKNRTGEIAFLGEAMKFEPLRMSAADSQLIEQLRWTAEMVCGVFGVPAFKAGIGDAPTYQNGELLNQKYYSDCLQVLIEEMELCLDQALGLYPAKTGGRSIGVELDLSGLLRMDTATQMETLVKGVRGGVLTPNGARRKLDEAPLEGGDTIYLQHQDYPMEKVFNRGDLDPQPEPGPALPAAAEEEPDDDVRAWLPALTRDTLAVVQERAALLESAA